MRARRRASAELGKAFGFPNSALGGMIDYNLANAAGAVITFEGRSPFLGFDVPEAILLGNSAFSNYHSAQFSLTKRFSKGLQFNLAYTYLEVDGQRSADPGQHGGRRQARPAERRFHGAGQRLRHARQLRALGLRPHAPVQRELRLRTAVVWQSAALA